MLWCLRRTRKIQTFDKVNVTKHTNKCSKPMGGDENVVMATVNKPQLFFPDPHCSYRLRFRSRFHPFKVY